MEQLTEERGWGGGGGKEARTKPDKLCIAAETLAIEARPGRGVSSLPSAAAPVSKVPMKINHSSEKKTFNLKKKSLQTYFIER